MTDIDRAAVLQLVVEGSRTQASAARTLGICERQLRRLLRRYEVAGIAGIIPRNRGKTPSNRVDDEVRLLVLDRCRNDYAGFGPTPLAKALADRDGIVVSREWIRALLIDNGLWTAQRREPRVAPVPKHLLMLRDGANERNVQTTDGLARTSSVARSTNLLVAFNRRTPDPKKVRTPAQNHPWKRPYQSQPAR